MVLLQCKLCGGNIELSTDKTFGTCDCCGSSVTFPKNHSAERAEMFNRGNYFRRIGEFDKALTVFEQILKEDYTDAEAHWCCALCRFGIEYVEDPFSHEWIPTCHRVSYDSFIQDIDYVTAVDYSDDETRSRYEKEAVKINDVQKGILATSRNEEPYDVFICYKETDADGERTKDSVVAQDIYNRLIEKNYRVFFARITLEKKLGVEYEPYIFAGLNSAKVMIVVGTSKENLEAVWVKNEWSRFIANMKKDNSKVLIPCYANMNPNDMPDALSRLQSYDMNKIGFVQDLVHGIGKIIRKKDKTASGNIDDAMSEQLRKITERQAMSRIERGDEQFRMGHYKEAYDYYADGLATIKNNFKAKYKKAICGIYLAEDNPPLSDFEKVLEEKCSDEMLMTERDFDLINFINAYKKQNSYFESVMKSEKKCRIQAQRFNMLFQVQSIVVTHLYNEKNLEEMLLKTIRDIDSWIATPVYYLVQTNNGVGKAEYIMSTGELDSLKCSRKICTAKYNSMPARIEGEKELHEKAEKIDTYLTELKNQLASLKQQQDETEKAFWEQNPELKKAYDDENGKHVTIGCSVFLVAISVAVVTAVLTDTLVAGILIFVVGMVIAVMNIAKKPSVQAQVPDELIQQIKKTEEDISVAAKEYVEVTASIDQYRKKNYVADI